MTLSSPVLDLTPIAADADAPLPYHRLALRARPVRWWGFLVVLPVALLVYVVLALALMIPAVGAGMAVPAWESAIDDALELTTMNEPAPLALGLLAVALLLPATLVAVRLVGRRPVGTLWSVAGRLRWAPLARAALVTAVMLGALQLVLALVDPVAVQPRDVQKLAISLVVVAVLVPFQATAEEVVFRGLLMQTVGSWLRHPAWAILLPLPLFVAGHLYSPAGLADVAVFALVAGYLTWRTGGLEAAIGLHVVNNLGAFGIALVVGADLDATEIAPATAALSIGYTLATAAVILALHRRAERRP